MQFYLVFCVFDEISVSLEVVELSAVCRVSAVCHVHGRKLFVNIKFLLVIYGKIKRELFRSFVEFKQQSSEECHYS